ncbi:MAG: hypothetical protein K1000chlam2_00037 [Chlamydiae bacterium]|nr:hypothetical protein [Chlamydiota bacterium]
MSHAYNHSDVSHFVEDPKDAYRRKNGKNIPIPGSNGDEKSEIEELRERSGFSCPSHTWP